MNDLTLMQFNYQESLIIASFQNKERMISIFIAFQIHLKEFVNQKYHLEETMKKLLPPIDSLSLIRFLHIHCFIHIYRVFFAKDASTFSFYADDHFSAPRFELFKTIKIWYKKKEASRPLFINILFSFQNEIIVGSIITLIFASCNLFVPQLIKSFLHLMRQHHVNKSELVSAQNFIQKFFIIQFLRIVFGEHSKRLFYELAVQIESSLCKKLIRKALTFERSCRDRMHKSEIMQLENVDLKLIFNMFKNMYMIVEAPFTIVVAIVLLFRESHVYGFIGIYWFIIAFLVQRELDSKMIHCNQTKLKLIDQRSKTNYELFERIKEAKIIHYEDLIVEKNNQLFIEQNHDHKLFYHYSTLYDITLLILPIIVVVTISLFDLNNDTHITVEQVYIMLELLGICYNPMKSFRTINISIHDGFHSLRKLQDFFELPEQISSTLIQSNIPPGGLYVQQNTKCAHPNGEFQLQIKHHVELKPGDRLIVLGKKGQGKTSFMRMIMGQMKKIKGSVFINSKTAASLENHFFRKVSLLQNILFSDNSEQSFSEFRQLFKDNKQKLKEIDDKIKQHKEKIKLAEVLYKQFGLESEFAAKQGIHTILDERSLTKKQMKKISLVRTFVANPEIYILEAPFNILDKSTAFAVQKRLRQKQQQGKTVIMTESNLEYVKPDDQIMIFEKGVSIEYETFEQIVKQQSSQICFYFKQKQDKDTIKEPDSARKIVVKFKNRVVSAMIFVQNSDDSNEDDKSVKSKDKVPNSPYLKYRSMSLAFNMKRKKLVGTEVESTDKWKYFVFYIKSVSFFEVFFILLIIAVAQFLHIFIHYFIGHLDEDQQDNPYLEFQNILMLEFILTMALALIIYFEGQISSLISVIQGNELYQKSIKSLVKKPINWFYQQFSVKLADKFNHDYEEIFIACHSLLGIYKNIIILIITINVVSAGRSNIFVSIFVVCAIYLSIGVILRRVEHKVVKHFYDYKYEFVKIFQECLDGGLTIQIFGGVDDVLRRTHKIYQQIAAYKLAESYTAYGEELFCDFTSLILLVIAFFYGLQIKIEGSHYSMALIGTSIHLLLNVSEVLKNIVKLTINFETFFKINITPFLQTVFEQKSNQHQMLGQQDQRHGQQDFLRQQTQNNEMKQRIRKNTGEMGYEIQFQNVVLNDSEDKFTLSREQKINLSIREESSVSIYEANEKARAKLVQALTKNNNQILQESASFAGSIKLGKVNIRDIPDSSIPDYVTVIMTNNFYWTGGTLRQNITWGKGSLSQNQEQEAINYARQLNLDQDLKDFDQLALDCPLSFTDVQTNSELNKKIAVLRTLIKKPKIVILKNTSSFIGQTSITQMIKNASFCTIIKITGNIQEIPGMTRAIYMQNLKVIENDKLSKFENNPNTKIGKLLEQINMESYQYFNKAVFSPRKLRKKKDTSRSVNFSGYDTERSSHSEYSLT